MVLNETGIYTFGIYVYGPSKTRVGTYSFAIHSLPLDGKFNIQIGDLVSVDSPAVGAGKIETSGSEDLYKFTATSGQILSFESIALSNEFDGFLAGRLTSPSGQDIFDDYFNQFKSRVVLPETGIYTFKIYVFAPSKSRFGTYSFRIDSINSDGHFQIQIGAIVGDGAPGAGAGKIEAPGSQDFYTFSGMAGQILSFESVAFSQEFDGFLVGHLTSPSGKDIFDDYFKQFKSAVVLPETGTYAFKIYVNFPSAARIGTYSFRIFSPIRAIADSLAVSPGVSVSIPAGKLTANDIYANNDNITVSLPQTQTPKGGLVSLEGGIIKYTPALNFSGSDSFLYHITGLLGGEDQATVTVNVVAGGSDVSQVISFIILPGGIARFCVLGTTNESVRVEQSEDLRTWSFIRSLNLGSDGTGTFDFSTDDRTYLFYRFIRQ